MSQIDLSEKFTFTYFTDFKILKIV